ncbi:hypothetical protein [Gordonia sp. NB41Y]|uniref:hypothetical protein n=1 Tax=Gordonia sp. NB41Y TaxID=875808 RepID=UPI0002BF0894|nr:hypothetical protein [Gordonia sp. NB41Y]EMP12491.1 hypothetical protein ISGA_1785 [Gordonia sp. NB41Y]WLP91304.1 hypothetical protein Q9K23_03270 [Gordonia sp. NB41Y]
MSDLDPFAAGLSVDLGVWPVYVGVSDDPSPRAQITYRHEDGQIVGSARLSVPSGTYARLHYFHTPTGPATGGVVDIDPITMPVAGVIEIDPITMTE